MTLEKTSLEHMLEEEKIKRLSTIGSLSARMVHDLRNSLFVIKNSTEIMKRKVPEISEENKVILDGIDRAIFRMSRQIDEVLDYVSPKPINVKKNSILSILHSTIDRIQMADTVTIQLSENDAIIPCDIEKMEIVFFNIITNAIQAMNNKGEIKIVILEKKDNVIVRIHDTGEGIADNVLPKIFEPLFTTKQTGTGLGLISCKAIIEKHHGRIDVETKIGVGTTFIITLPKRNN